MEEINKKEAENLRIYNAFVSEEEMSTYQESGLQEVREIYGESLNENIYYIHITKFHTKESFKNLQKYIPEMKSHENIIVDFRNNTGGYFDSLREISDIMVGPEGSQIPEGGIIPDIIVEDKEKQLMEAVDYINSLITQENRLPVSLSLCIVPLC